MAKRGTPSGPVPAQLSIEQLRAALPKLERRLTEFKGLDYGSLTDENEDRVLGGLRRKLDDTLMEIYGADTTDYHRYSVHSLDDTPMSLGGGWPSVRSRIPDIKSAVDRAIGNIETAIEITKERIGDAGGDAASKAVRAYAGLDLHPEIARAASKLYTDGHYANAVEAAVKRLNGLVRLRSDLEVDGTSLMERAFSPSNPILKFNDLSDQSDRDEQKGFMMMFSGAVSGLRNPRAHGFINDDPERALEFIAFVSLLAKLLDGAST
ncbi:TIGR02391 family protein [Bradyrhizobium liaoningense]|uniref:TIGR02391 family protein n=1 Tax=Bradyrhizobium liaoningense TaxID=43992 RepID=UPI001BAAA45A|nr:TIGR02391 family protein [Bradyrhizobium liaoningense]MBR0716426.1 TIGR02391 family protein [Bradyrhizobium liaoningense]